MVSAAVGDRRSFISGLAARFEQIGLDVITWAIPRHPPPPGVKDAVFSTADNVTNWFKSKLGINSPSRVFMELGGYTTMAGLVQGVGKGEPGALKAIGEFSRRFATTARAWHGRRRHRHRCPDADHRRPSADDQLAAYAGRAVAGIQPHRVCRRPRWRR